MCFQDTYNCVVTCTNGIIDNAAAINGTIKSTGFANMCSVQSCGVVNHMTEETMYPPLLSSIPFIEYILGVVVIIIVLLACLIVNQKPEKP